jgi:hypothetical protein
MFSVNVPEQLLFPLVVVLFPAHTSYALSMCSKNVLVQVLHL